MYVETLFTIRKLNYCVLWNKKLKHLICVMISEPILLRVWMQTCTHWPAKKLKQGGIYINIYTEYLISLKVGTVSKEKLCKAQNWTTKAKKTVHFSGNTSSSQRG